MRVSTFFAVAFSVSIIAQLLVWMLTEHIDVVRGSSSVFSCLDMLQVVFRRPKKTENSQDGGRMMHRKATENSCKRMKKIF